MRRLGYGEKGPKSSAGPKTVDSLGGKCTLQVACRVGTAFLVKREDAEGCPVFEPKGPAPREEAPKRAGRTAAPPPGRRARRAEARNSRKKK